MCEYAKSIYYSKIGNYNQAEILLLKTMEIHEKILDTEHHNTAIIYHNIAGAYKQQDDYQKALEYYNKALKIEEKVLGTENIQTKITRENYETLLEKMRNG